MFFNGFDKGYAFFRIGNNIFFSSKAPITFLKKSRLSCLNEFDISIQM